MPQVTVAGHICLDVIPDLSGMELAKPGAFFTPGSLRVVGPADLSTGGPVSNTGLNLTKLGVDTQLMGKVGADPFGDAARRLLEKDWGLRDTLICDRDVNTSYTVVVNPKGYDRMFLHCPGANDTFSAADIDYEQVNNGALFHFGYPPLMQKVMADEGRELIDIFRHIHDLGVTTSLDMCLPDIHQDKTDWRAVMKALAPHLDLYLGSAEETLFMLQRDRYLSMRQTCEGDLLEEFTGDLLHELSEELLDCGVRVAVIKCGPRGYYVRTPGRSVLETMGRARPGDMNTFENREFWHPAFHCDGVPNATGSGDASIAGFLSAYLRGLSLLDCVIVATCAGSASVEKPDALSGVPDWDGVQARIKTIARDPLQVSGKGWKTDKSHPFLWLGPADQQVKNEAI